MAANGTGIDDRGLRLLLSMYDPKMLTSPDGKRIEIDISAIHKLLDRFAQQAARVLTGTTETAG